MRAKVIESCVYNNEFRGIDDVVEGTQEDLQTHIDFGYVEVIGKAENVETEEPEEPEDEVVEPEPVEAKPKSSKSHKK
ncbi:hypothetical protein [Anaeroglobus geminatus]|uniref:Uncharacterized protein n=1 Tax=Anaeroglobus geminatus F0357 TaxID=861450 RepID=G9YK40_9FIRM|nr:hypothetical protein [Anaeroglobus geminatus]EHM37865.1 hypothetical protein HMPREF0080_02049 [Anaeroglobus geminatus F0357]